MFSVENHAHDGQHQVEAKPDRKMRVQENVREDSMIHKIKDRPGPHWNIQEQADHQARVVAFAGFDPQCDMYNSREE